MAAARGTADRAQQLAGVRLAHDVGERAAAQRLRHVPLVEIARENDDGGARRQLAHSPRHFQPVQARHGDVGDEHVRLEAFGQRQDFEPVGGFADDFKICFTLDEATQRLANYLLVFGQQNAGHLALPGARRAAHAARSIAAFPRRRLFVDLLTEPCKKNACWRERC